MAKEEDGEVINYFMNGKIMLCKGEICSTF